MDVIADLGGGKTGSSGGSPILEINHSAFRRNRQGELSGRFSCFVPLWNQEEHRMLDSLLRRLGPFWTRKSVTFEFQ